MFLFLLLMVKWQGVVKNVGGEVGDSGGVDDIVVKGDDDVMSVRTTLMLSFVSFFGSMIFWSQNITGNVILEFGEYGANWIGAILFLLAVLGFLVYVRKSKK